MDISAPVVGVRIVFLYFQFNCLLLFVQDLTLKNHALIAQEAVSEERIERSHLFGAQTPENKSLTVGIDPL